MRVVGCGGAGTNTIHRIMSAGLPSARTIAVNTDWAHLGRTRCDRSILLGDGAVHSTGGRPDLAIRLALRHERELRTAICGGELTFITAGLGGGTGTGVAPLLAKWSRASGAVVIGVVTAPFRAEAHRQETAMHGLEMMLSACNSLVVLENDRLLECVPDLPVEEAFAVMDHLIGEVVRGVVSALHGPSLIQLDFPDLREILAQGGPSTILFGEGDVHDPESVVENAMSNALVDGDPRAARGAVVHVTAGPNLPVRAVDRVIGGLTRAIRQDARVAFGVRTDAEFEGALRMMAILTGVHAKVPPPEPPLEGAPMDVPAAG